MADLTCIANDAILEQVVYSTFVLIGGRDASRPPPRLVQQDRSDDLAVAVEAVRVVLVGSLPNLMLLAVFCAVWAVVFELALR